MQQFPPVAHSSMHGAHGPGLVGFLSVHVLEGAGRRLSSQAGHAHVVIKYGNTLHRSGPAAPVHISQDARAFWGDAEFEIDVYENTPARFIVTVYADDSERDPIGEAVVNFSKMMTSYGRDQTCECDTWINLSPSEALRSAAPAMLHLFLSYFSVDDTPLQGRLAAEHSPRPGEVLVNPEPGEGGSLSDSEPARIESPATPRVEANRPPRKQQPGWPLAADSAKSSPRSPRSDRESEAILSGVLGSGSPSMRRVQPEQPPKNSKDAGWSFFSCLKCPSSCCGKRGDAEPEGQRANALPAQTPAPVGSPLLNPFSSSRGSSPPSRLVSPPLRPLPSPLVPPLQSPALSPGMPHFAPSQPPPPFELDAARSVAHY